MNKIIDFFLVYGWLFLIALVVIATSLYFNFFDSVYTQEDCIIFCDHKNMVCAFYTQNTVSCYPDLSAYYTKVFNWSTGEEIGFD